MYEVIAVLSLLFVIYSLIRSYQNRKWKLISSCLEQDEYSNLITMLKLSGIPYKVQVPSKQYKHTQYDIYVKIEDEIRAIYLISIDSTIR